MELARIKLFMESADPQERKNAALALAEQDPSVAAGPLAQLLKDANQAVSEAAQMSLSLLGGRATIEALVPLLSSPIAALRNAAIEVLRKVGQDDLGLLHGLTGNSDDHVRIFSVDIIGSIASPSSVDVLCECLLDANPNVRNAALVALGNIGAASALPAMLPLIDDQEWIRFTLIEALGRIGGPEAVDFLANQLDRWSEDEMTLGAIVDSLGAIGDRAGLAPLLLLLPRVDGFVGISLIRALVGVIELSGLADLAEPERSEIKRIIENNILCDEVQIDLLEMLALVGDRFSSAVLMELAGTLDQQADADRVAALLKTMVALDLSEAAAAMLQMDEHLVELGADVICQTGGQDDALIEALDRSQGPVRRNLARALSGSVSSEAKACLRRLTADPDGHVAAIAIKAAARWAVDEDDMAGLGAYLKHDYPDVRAAALDAICSLEPGQSERVLLAQYEAGDQQICQLALEGLARIESASLPRLIEETMKVQPLEALRLARDFNIRLESALVETALDSSDPALRQTALDLVGRQKLQPLRFKVEAAVDDSNNRCAYQAILALGRFNDAAAREILMRKLQSGTDLIKVAVLKAFAEWEDEALAEELEFCLEDDNPDIAHACRRLLDKLNGV